jgi:hypothetical protein
MLFHFFAPILPNFFAPIYRPVSLSTVKVHQLKGLGEASRSSASPRFPGSQGMGRVHSNRQPEPMAMKEENTKDHSHSAIVHISVAKVELSLAP